ncbi:hypothetical protein CXG81DRAFT_7190, partial [Caulochytrium protostelioides]
LSTYLPRLKVLLREANLEQVSATHLRKQIESEFQVDLRPQKQPFKELVHSTLTEIFTSGHEAHAPAAAHQASSTSATASSTSSRPSPAPAAVNSPAASRAKNPFSVPQYLSPALVDVVQIKTATRPEVIKALWKYIKDHKLQDPDDGRFIFCDAPLKRVLGKNRANAFAMNKILGAHLRTEAQYSENPHFSEIPMTEDDVVKPRTPGVKGAKGTKRKAAAPRKKRDPSKMPQYRLSPDLAKVCGFEQHTRPQVVKQIWVYVKANQLQDPQDGRFILCNDLLRRIFETDKVSAFSMNSHLSRHLTR